MDTAAPPAVRSPSTVTPLLVAALALLGGLAVVGLRLAAHDGDPTVFVRFGERHVVASEAPVGAEIADSAGYDGQYFYRIARDPFSRADRVDGVDLDRPAFRTRRIAYPAAAWALALGGRRSLVPWTLVAVNLGSLAALTGAVAVLARDAGASPWLGLLAAGWPGFLVALVSDLSEIGAAAALAWALVALRRQQWVGAAVLLTLAVLTRESTALLALGVGGAAVLGHLPLARRLGLSADRTSSAPGTAGPPLWVGVVPLGVLAAWLVTVDRWWSGRETDTAMAQTADQFGWPLEGPVRQLGSFLGGLGDAVTAYQFVQFAIVVLMVVTAAGALRDREVGRPHERLALVGALLTTSMLITWDRAVVFLRYPDEIVVLAVVLAASCAPALLRVLRSAVPTLLITALPVWIVIA